MLSSQQAAKIAYKKLKFFSPSQQRQPNREMCTLAMEQKKTYPGIILKANGN